MDQKPKLMTPFDMLVTSSSLYTLKLMLPFLHLLPCSALSYLHKIFGTESYDGTFLWISKYRPSWFRPGAIKNPV